MAVKTLEFKKIPVGDWADTVVEILKRGNVAEVKREKDNIVVVEIKRQVRVKKPMSPKNSDIMLL